MNRGISARQTAAPLVVRSNHQALGKSRIFQVVHGLIGVCALMIVSAGQPVFAFDEGGFNFLSPAIAPQLQPGKLFPNRNMPRMRRKNCHAAWSSCLLETAPSKRALPKKPGAPFITSSVPNLSATLNSPLSMPTSSLWSGTTRPNPARTPITRRYAKRWLAMA